jgi:putative ABC transport system permease protein
LTNSCEGQAGKIGANTLSVSSARQFFGGGGGEQNSYQASQQEIETYYGTQVLVMNAGSMVSSVESITSQMTVFLGSIGAVSLFVAALGITNTMFVSVMERTREIGILKALGYKPKQIMGMFLSEAILSGVVGGFGGTILGYVLSFIIGGALPMSGGFGMGGAPPRTSQQL